MAMILKNGNKVIYQLNCIGNAVANVQHYGMIVDWFIYMIVW